MRSVTILTICAAIILSVGVPPVTASAFPAVATKHVSHTVIGRVTNAKGRPISHARLTLTDNENVTRVAYTSSFGYYRFDNIPSGDLYVLSVSHKSYLFGTPTQVIEIFDDQMYNFVGEINSARAPK